MERSRASVRLPHCVHLQCTCQMLCSFSADVVDEKIQRCECLCEMDTGNMCFVCGRIAFSMLVTNMQSGRAFSEKVVGGKMFRLCRSLMVVTSCLFDKIV